LVAGVEEVPGCGLRRLTPEGEIRLGRRGWAVDAAEDAGTDLELWLSRPGQAPVCFRFEDTLRTDAAEVVAELKRRGYGVALLSGDREPTVRRVAAAIGIERWQGGCTPAGKTAALEALAAEGKRVLMVGDGLNDAPALAAAHVSLSPSTAVDISQTAADAVFQGSALAPVLEVLAISRRAQALVKQNMGLSLGYNILTVPLAMAGFVTPLVAAIAMSTSSIGVVLNSLRLSWRTPRPKLG
jgi:Cu2+-exporting ATPase